MSPNIPQLPLLQTISTNNRNRSLSLSIARSPAIFASTSSTSSNVHSSDHHPHPPMTRIRSNPSYHARTKSTLEDINDNSPEVSDSESEPEIHKGSSEAGRLLRIGDDDVEDGTYLRGRGESGAKGLGYRGTFQPPSSGELLGVALSFGGVLLLSVAAGLTTIYDWVL